jgi:AraC-like DNA-binding protein/mannose-6-phosphate isomerase-like protein (cupin superfamily)
MRVVYRAQDEPPATREEYWRDIIDRTIAPMDVRFPGGLHEREQIVTGHVGVLNIASWESGPGEVTHTTAHARRSDPDVFHLFVHGQGRVVGEQAGRQAELDPGDVTLVDTSLPFRCIHEVSDVVCLTIPWTLLPAAQQSPDTVAGVLIGGVAGPGALLSSLVRQLPGHLEGVDGQEGFRVGTALVDLLSATLAVSNGTPDHQVTDWARRSLVQRILAYIEDRLADPELSPATVAEAHHISVRYLHKLFAAQDRTVAAFIRSRRLERSRRDLLDPALRARPVSAIAARHGFTEPAHFSRAFRAAYGRPPGEYRRLAIG